MVDTYTEPVRQFTAFLVRQGMPTQLESVTREHVESFIEELLAKIAIIPFLLDSGLRR